MKDDLNLGNLKDEMMIEKCNDSLRIYAFTLQKLTDIYGLLLLSLRTFTMKYISKYGIPSFHLCADRRRFWIVTYPPSLVYITV